MDENESIQNEVRHTVTINRIKKAIMFEKSIISDDLPNANSEEGYSDLVHRAHSVKSMMDTLLELEILKDVLDDSCKHPSVGKANYYCPDCGSLLIIK